MAFSIFDNNLGLNIFKTLNLAFVSSVSTTASSWGEPTWTVTSMASCPQELLAAQNSPEAAKDTYDLTCFNLTQAQVSRIMAKWFAEPSAVASKQPPRMPFSSSWRSAFAHAPTEYGHHRGVRCDHATRQATHHGSLHN